MLTNMKKSLEEEKYSHANRGACASSLMLLWRKLFARLPFISICTSRHKLLLPNPPNPPITFNTIIGQKNLGHHTLHQNDSSVLLQVDTILFKFNSIRIHMNISYLKNTPHKMHSSVYADKKVFTQKKYLHKKSI